MKFKPDWEQAKERLTALWRGQLRNGPCMSVHAPSGKGAPYPPEPAGVEDRWINPRWVVSNALAQIANTWWGGEAVPSYLLMAGWVNCLGGTPRFAPQTIWFEHIEVDFDRPPALRFDPRDPWVRRYEALHRAMVQAAGRDDFLIGQCCILPACDLLSMLMGTENFLVALMDHPRWMREAICQGARVQTEARQYFERITAEGNDFWYGNGGWMCFWAPEPYAATQSDVSCMMSPAMFDEFIVPELDIYGRRHNAMWYHLDGGDAQQHLPRLLSLPYMRVIQYVPAPCEPPNGPGHLDLYRKIQAAGKIVHIQVAPENVAPLVKALDCSCLMLDVYCDNVDDGRKLLQSVGR